MSGKRYTDEFRIEAARQVAERGDSVADVVRRSGITTHSPYAWRAKSDKPDVVRRAELDQSAQVRRLKAELKRVIRIRGSSMERTEQFDSILKHIGTRQGETHF